MQATGTHEEHNLFYRIWNNKDARAVFIQIITVMIMLGFFAFLIRNAALNLEALGKTFGFEFLGQIAGYDINQTMIEFDSRDTHLRAYFVGLLNTLLVAFMSVVAASILGFIFGVLRLSSNWLVSRLVYVYIEYARNVPLLLHILLIHGVLLGVLPRARQALNFNDSVFLSNRGLYMPSPVFEDGAIYPAIMFIIAIIASVWFYRYAKKLQADTGKILPVFSIVAGMLIILPVITFYLAGSPLSWDVPALKGLNFKGGVAIKPELLSLWLSLSLYTTCFIAEIVRAGILAISWGQSEAAYALGLRPNRTMQLIVIPQALRVIVPPLTSQYLNVVKNSSLALIIGYMDVVATIGGISLNQTGREMECMIIVLSTYLSISLLISAFMNWYNKRTKLVER